MSHIFSILLAALLTMIVAGSGAGCEARGHFDITIQKPNTEAVAEVIGVEGIQP